MSNTQLTTFHVVATRQPFGLFEPRPWRPPLNVYDTQQGIPLAAELAGVAPDDLHPQVHPTNVQVHGTRQLAAPAGLHRIQRMEIASDPFQVVIRLEKGGAR